MNPTKSTFDVVAQKLVEIFEPVCRRLAIAGSIRRGAVRPGDVELVVEPRVETVHRPGSLFDTMEVCQVAALVERMTQRGTWLRFDTEKPANGDRLKRLRTYTGIQVELWIVRPPASFGAILAIRTGPADFSKMLVTQRAHGGAMRYGFRQQDGALWGPAGQVDTDTEEAYFAALGVPTWAPGDRSAERLAEYLRKDSHACHFAEEKPVGAGGAGARRGR